MMEFETACHQANVNAKAQKLFALGYSGRWASSDAVEVISPGGLVYRVDVVEQSCECLHFKEHGFCSHLWGWPYLMQGMAQDTCCVYVSREGVVCNDG